MSKKQVLEERPILDKDEDSLGRGPFVEVIARAVRAYRGKDSLVIGLYGEWGSGKTSVVNLLIKQLESEPATKPDIINFNPWQWSNQEVISKVFFKRIEEGLLGKNTTNEAKDNSKKFRKLAAYLGFASHMSEGIRKGVAGTLGGLSLLGFVGVLTGFPGVGLAFSSGFAILSALLAFSESFASKAALIFESQSTQSDLDEIRRSLKDELRKREKPLLVIIDDVDRLTGDEVRNLFTTVKSNADFPNFIYLLLFQRDIVERHLEKLVENNGSEYLKKIIQIPFDIPSASHKSITRVLEEGIDRILNQLPIDNKFDKDRWINIYPSGIRDYFTNLRDVKRFLSVLEFTSGAFVNKNVFEVNPVDLLGIECLKMFEPKLYQYLPSQKALLTGTIARDTLVGLEPKKGNALVEKLFENITDKHKDHAKQILGALFLSLDGYRDGYRIDYANHDETAQTSRVCHESYFDRYFQMTLSENEVSDAELNELISVSGEKSKFLQILKTAIANGRIHEFLGKVNNLRGLIPNENSIEYLTALCDIGDETPEEITGSSEISSFRYLGSMFDGHLRKYESDTERHKILLEVFENTKGIDLPLYLMSFESRKQKIQGNDDRLIRDTETFEKAKKILLNKIELRSQNNTLSQSNYYLPALDRWIEWGIKETAYAYLKNILATKEGAIRLVCAAINMRISYSVGAPIIEWTTNLERLKKYTKIETLQSLLSGVDVNTLNDKEKRGVEVFNRTIKNQIEGKSSEESFAEWP